MLFLEQCGKFFFLKIRPLFFFALVLIPLIGAGFYLSQEANSLQDLQERFAKAARKERFALERKERKERFLQRYSSANPYFLDHNIESFPLLEREKEQLDSLLRHPAFPESRALQERLRFLQENRLVFREEKIEVSKEMKEVEERQQHPVQMDEADLKQILAMIEDVSIDDKYPIEHSPHMIIKEFHLKKRKTPLQTEVFEVEMDLIKREFYR